MGHAPRGRASLRIDCRPAYTLHTISDKRRYVVRVVSPRTTQRTPLFNVLLCTHTLRSGLLLQQVRRGACGLPRNRSLSSRVRLLPAPHLLRGVVRQRRRGGTSCGPPPIGPEQLMTTVTSRRSRTLRDAAVAVGYPQSTYPPHACAASHTRHCTE